MESRVRIGLEEVAFGTSEIANDVWRPIEPGAGRGFLAHLVACTPRLRRLAIRLTGRPGAETDDLVQETLLRALQKSYQFKERPGSDLFSWTSQILRHAFLDHRRKQRPEVLVAQFAATEPECATHEVATWRYVEDADLDDAIRALSPPLRDTYRLFAAGHCYEAIGIQLAIPVKTVGVRIHRARARLRAALQTTVDRARLAA